MTKKTLLFLFMAALSWGTYAQSSERMSPQEIRALVERVRQSMLDEGNRERRVQILKDLEKRLGIEVERGAATMDDAVIEALGFLTSVEYMTRKNCDDSRRLIATANAGVSDPDGLSLRQRKAKQYYLQIHAALCRDN